jgi:hypothetical protein
MEWNYEHMTPFCCRHPTWPDNLRRDLVNGPLRWRTEAVRCTVKKLIKSAMASRAVIECLFAATWLLERTTPRTRILPGIYRLLLGVHIFRGYRRGLA